MQFAILGKDVNGNIPSGEGCQWKHTFWGRMSMETYLLGKDVNGNIPSGEGCQWKHTFWTCKKKKKCQEVLWYDIEGRFMQKHWGRTTKLLAHVNT